MLRNSQGLVVWEHLEELPQVHGRLSGSGRGSASNGIYTWHREGEIRVSFNHMVDRDFNIPFGSTLELLAEVVDGNGLHYRVVLEHWSVNENGENMEDDYR